MRVGIIAFQHESNTFALGQTTLEQFQRDGLQTGTAVRDAWADSHHELGGIFQGLAQEKIEAIPLLMALAWPGGTVTDSALTHIMAMMREQLGQVSRLDGLIVAPHGAGVSEKHRDMDGHWLSWVRSVVGPTVHIVCTIDPHANVSHAMVDSVDAMIAYHTNPHEDQHAIGLEAAHLMARTLRGEVQPVLGFANPPVAISIDKQETGAEPCLRLYEPAAAMLKRPGVLSVSIALGFPYADVAELGSSFLVVTDNDRVLAQRCANELAAILVRDRKHFACGLTSVEDAVKQVAASSQRTCLLDVGDNVGGGAPADGTLIAHELHRTRVGPAVVVLTDKQAVQRAREAGVGRKVTLEMGGKTDDRHGKPLVTPVTVKSLHEGKFTESQPRHGGRMQYDQGMTAVVMTEHGLTVILNSSRTPPFSLEQIRSCNLDPSHFKALVAKGVNAPITAYREVCERFIRVNTPGVTCADMRQFKYEHRRRPLYPCEEI